MIPRETACHLLHLVVRMLRIRTNIHSSYTKSKVHRNPDLTKTLMDRSQVLKEYGGTLEVSPAAVPADSRR
jgi:hypothetical protein